MLRIAICDDDLNFVDNFAKMIAVSFSDAGQQIKVFTFSDGKSLIDEAEKERQIFDIRRKGNLLILMVENGYALEPVIENGIFVTRKKDKDLHAIGMRSIRYVVEKYGVVVNNSYENNWFKATVMLRGYDVALSDEN